jgi:formate dehydrogenase major subunit
MVVRTQSPQLAKLRRNVMELYISDHPLDCLTCAANGDCELQDMAGAVGLREVRYGAGRQAMGAISPTRRTNRTPISATTRPSASSATAACAPARRSRAASPDHRRARLRQPRGTAGQTDPSSAAECVSCGACVKACPTATLTEKTVIEHGQAERAVMTTCAYCGVGCGFKAEVQGDRKWCA